MDIKKRIYLLSLLCSIGISYPIFAGKEKKEGATSRSNTRKKIWQKFKRKRADSAQEKAQQYVSEQGPDTGTTQSEIYTLIMTAFNKKGVTSTEEVNKMLVWYIES